MLNLKLGPSRDVDGRPWIATVKGRAGFALYGPYEVLAPGRYAAIFQLRPAEAAQVADGSPANDPRCVALDVTADGGDTEIAHRWVHASQMADGRVAYNLPFTVERATPLEFRAWVSGELPLLIADTPRIMPALTADDPELLPAFNRFPDEDVAAPFLRAHRDVLRDLFDRGTGIAIIEGRVVLRVAHVSFFCDSMDDLQFVSEVFHEGTYNFTLRQPTCVIDIGMNVGLSSLQFAGKDEVRQVHAFEPFVNTFDRAADNLRLNPLLAAKISAHPFGLSDREVDGALRLIPPGDSGSANVIEREDGEPVHVVLRDAGTVLAPIIEAAHAAGEIVVVKVDCEGSEFAVFASLARCGLLDRIGAFMVEWHAMFPDWTRDRLIDPLRAAGFLVIDRSPPTGNGFFYAVRVA